MWEEVVVVRSKVDVVTSVVVGVLSSASERALVLSVVVASVVTCTLITGTGVGIGRDG